MTRSIATLAMLLVPIATYAQAAPQPISTVLLTNLDARHVKVGDAVKVRTYSGIYGPGGQRIPPGSVLVGHVTEAAKLVKGTTDSRLAVVFDQAQLASGQTVAVHLGIAGLAAAPPAGLEEANDGNPTAESRYLGPTPTAATAIPARGTMPNHDNRTSRGDMVSSIGNNGTASTAGDHVAPVASVGSTIPGISLQPNPATQSILVSNTTNVALRDGMPLVLLPIADQQH